MKRILEKEIMDTKEEVLAYDKIVRIHDYWMNRPQVKAVLRLLRKKNGISLLDIGTGTARIPIEIAKRKPNCKIHAVDLSLDMLKVGSKNLTEEKLKDKIVLLHADGKQLPFDKGSFDMVICANMLHQLRDPLPLLNEMNRVAKDEGIILIRDLIRPPTKLILNLFVGIFGLPYSRLMKKEYRDSLCAAFTIKEYKEIIAFSDMRGAKMSIEFPHFVSIFKEPQC